MRAEALESVGLRGLRLIVGSERIAPAGERGFDCGYFLKALRENRKILTAAHTGLARVRFSRRFSPENTNRPRFR